jgi:dihydroorotate dehydrogenase (fumarate)
MDLSTNYLGFKLKNPVMLGASPIIYDLDQVKRAEDAGASAIVMNSLFEEQIEQERAAQEEAATHDESFAEAQSYLPATAEYLLGPEAYLEQVRKVKAAVGVPVIGSLNGTTATGWLDYAKLIEQAGADALELNVYSVGSDVAESGAAAEKRIVDMVAAVTQKTRLPVAVKLSPFYTALPNFAQQLAAAGAKGLVLFNRFYQPDIDLDELEVDLKLELSTSSELLMRLRWLAILSGRVNVSLGLSGGAHTPQDVLKAVMAGAHGVQVVSAALKRGVNVFGELRSGLNKWLTDHEYESLAQAQGSMNLSRSPNPGMYERGNYIRILQKYARR